MSELRQQDFDDLARAHRKELIRNLKLPDGKHRGDTVTGEMLCRVLKAIETFCNEKGSYRCWATRESIAERADLTNAKYPARTVSRATAILESCGVLLRVNGSGKPRKLNVWIIDYNVVKLFTERRPRPEQMMSTTDQTRDTVSHMPGHGVPFNGDTVSHITGHGVPQIERESNKKPPPTKRESVVVDCDVSWKDAETTLAAADVVMVGDTIEAAKQSGLTPSDVVRIASEGKTRCDGPGGIRHRITKGGWPDGAPDRQDAITAASLTPEQRKRLDRERAERIRNDARCDVKRKHGLPIREPDASRAVFDTLKAAGLERFATESERAAGASTSHYGKQAS